MIRTLLVIPFLVVLIAFALSNQQSVQLGMWPFDVTMDVQLSIAVLVIGGLFFFLGALIVWLGTLPARAKLRRAQRRIAMLESEALAVPTPAGTAVAVRA